MLHSLNNHKTIISTSKSTAYSKCTIADYLMRSPTASLKWIESTEPKHQVKLSGRSASSPCQYTPPKMNITHRKAVEMNGYLTPGDTAKASHLCQGIVDTNALVCHFQNPAEGCSRGRPILCSSLGRRKQWRKEAPD